MPEVRICKQNIYIAGMELTVISQAGSTHLSAGSGQAAHWRFLVQALLILLADYQF